jgi:hypothetical protein
MTGYLPEIKSKFSFGEKYKDYKKRFDEGTVGLLVSFVKAIETSAEVHDLGYKTYEELRPLIINEVVNLVFPKKKELEPGCLCYYRPSLANPVVTKSQYKNKSSFMNSTSFLYKYGGIYESTFYTSVLKSHVYTSVGTVPDGVIVMFLGYLPDTKLHTETEVSPVVDYSLGGGTWVSKIKETDFLRSKCEIIFGDQKLILGFPRLPWARHMIPDDILVPV